MVTKNARIAYLKRMLKRLDEEKVRIQRLISSGELSPEGAKLGTKQVDANREQLLSELRKLESGLP